MQGMHRSLTLKGATTAGQRFSAELDQVKRLIAFGSLYTYLAVLLLEITLNIANASGGNLTWDWEMFYDCITGVDLNFKAAQKRLWEFTLSGGQAIRHTFYLKHRRLPDVQADVTINNGANTNIYLKLPIEFYDLRSESPEDELLWADLLADSQIDFTVQSNTAFYSAGVTFTVAATLTAYAVPRAEIRFPTLVRHTEQTMLSSAQDTLNLNGTYPMDLVLMPVNAAGVTATVFSAANLTAVKLVQDGVTVLDSTNPTTLHAFFNLDVQASGDRLSQFEAGGNMSVILSHFDASNGQKSKLTYVSKKPDIYLTGTISVANFRILHRYIIPSGVNTAIAAFAAIGMAVSPGELRAKTSSKVPVMDPSVLQCVPWKYVKGGTTTAKAA